MAVKMRTIRYIIEHELTWKELRSPEDTPSEWWQVPASRTYTSVDSAMSAADEWQKTYPGRNVRLVEIEEIRTSYMRNDGGTGWYTQK